MSQLFKLKTNYKPLGDQPKAIKEITNAFLGGEKHQTLLGVTGSGKTFTAAHIIQNLQKPTLVLAHNKTLAAQLYGEFKAFFPENSVQYFVSYYDYYQPEAYVPSSDTYIDKDATINDAIDRMRHAATISLFERKDTIIIASVSCIYGLGTKDSYHEMKVSLQEGDELDRDELIRSLIEIQYTRNDYDFHRSTFRVRGDSLEILPANSEKDAIRVEWFGDEIDSIKIIDPILGTVFQKRKKITIYPSSHYVVQNKLLKKAMENIKVDLKTRLKELKDEEKLLEAQRLEQRTEFDLEMMNEMGYCNGIENYSRYLTNRKPGEAPPVLLEYFPDDFLMIIDESHQTVSQVGAMFKGDRARKQNLVDFGFRLPSALDNRPLKFEEFEQSLNQVLYVSATPGNYELEKTAGVVSEQIIRPTGLLDPQIFIEKSSSQIDHLLGEVKQQAEKKERTLVTTLTKRMSEELTEYFQSAGLKVKYLHSDIDTLDRILIIQDLRRGVFDVLIGINLLREGLDIPEVTLVAILDADKQGFLRSERSLIQTMGRAARNAKGRVICYADKMTPALNTAIKETQRRRKIQEAYNKKHNIIPQTILKPIRDLDLPTSAKKGRQKDKKSNINVPVENAHLLNEREFKKLIKQLQTLMKQSAKDLQFEEAAKIRDTIQNLEEKRITTSEL